MIIVYKFGCAAPHEGTNVVHKQLLFAHRYRNQLVEIERGRRATFAACAWDGVTAGYARQARLKPFQFASGHSSQSPDGHRQNRRWGPCSHCGASGWDVIGQRVSGLFDHDRPDGRHCVAAARNLERAHLLNPVQSEGSSRAIRSMGAAMISSGNGCAP